MQWSNDARNSQQNVQQDVYADLKTSYSGDSYQDTQEFSLAGIQQKLGALTAVEEPEVNNSADIQPTTQTMTMSYNRNYSEEKVVGKSRLTTKSKVLIASYAIVVLALVIAVTLCSVSVGSTFGAATQLSIDYSQATAQLVQLTEEVQTEDYQALIERATELGYIDASSSNTLEYTELETRPAQNFEVQTNWFDSLCDWLSNVFGG